MTLIVCIVVLSRVRELGIEYSEIINIRNAISKFLRTHCFKLKQGDGRFDSVAIVARL